MKNVLLILICLLIISCKDNEQVKDHLNLESKLSGKWIAKAFDGELHEEWTLNDKGWMQQKGYYIEISDTSYVANTQIQQVGNDVILFSVIRNSNPKIFKLIDSNENRLVFENDDHKNPFQVKYEFISNKKYRRTIKGFENDSIVIYEFHFDKNESPLHNN